MEKRGFTLIELLAVIGVLAILLVLAVPMMMNSRRNTLNALSENQRKNLKYAGEVLGLDLDDYRSGIYNCPEGSWIADMCTTNKRQENNKEVEYWVEVTVPLSSLIEHEYFEDVQGHCKGEIKVTKTEDSLYDVDYSKVDCSQG